MPEYQRGKIYKIVCNITGEIYIGSTCEKYLSNRLSGHVSHTGKRPCSSKKIIERGDYAIILMEAYACNSKDELLARERHHIESNICINKLIPIRKPEEKVAKKKEWVLENKENLKEYHKKYRETQKDEARETQKRFKENNQEHMYEYGKKYREQQGEVLLKKKREYQQANKDKISVKNAAKYLLNKEEINAKRRANRKLNAEANEEFNRKRRETYNNNKVKIDE